MKIEKLPSGSYRVRKMLDGKTYSLTFDHRPTIKEIDAELAQRSTRYNGKMTFGEACKEYIQDRSNTLSPASVREYHNRLGRISDRLLEITLDDIRTQDIQKEINLFAKDHAPKTTQNQFLFMQSVLSLYRDDLRLRVKLPTRTVEAPYIPNTGDIQALLDYFKGTQMELVIRLATLGLRRGEICALQPADLDGHYLHISRDKVMDSNGKWIIKDTPKTSASNRTIYVTDRIVELINTVGIYNRNPQNIYTYLTKAQDKLGIPRFSVHKFRHYFASKALESMPEQDVMAFGGWNSDGVMKRIYQHRLNDRTIDVAKAITDSFD